MRGCLCEAISQHTHTTGSQHSILASCTKVEKQTHAQGVKAYTRCYSITLQISGPEVSTDRCPTFKHHFRWFTILITSFTIFPHHWSPSSSLIHHHRFTILTTGSPSLVHHLTGSPSLAVHHLTGSPSSSLVQHPHHFHCFTIFITGSPSLVHHPHHWSTITGSPS